MSSESEDRKIVCKYLTYRYKNAEGIFRTIRLPLVNIYLKSPTADTETIALLDTGATKTLLPLEYAQILSLQYLTDDKGNLLKIETVGAGGTFYCLLALLQKLCVKKKTKSFCTLTNIRVLVPAKEGVIPYVILGRDYVFNRFDITFHENRQKVTFTKA
jgi:hypothetical protein